MHLFKYDMMKWAANMFPFFRSLTGKGNDQTLQYLKKLNKNLKIIKFKSGKKVFDWTIPKVWIINKAYIEHIKTKKKYANIEENNLHIINYSSSVNKILNLKELKKKIYSNPLKPNSIPYVTSYYKKNWGFCMSHKQKLKLPNGNYKAIINSKFVKGYMNIGEIFIKGKSKKEIFFSTYICHPSMANNEISGPVLSIALSKYILENYKKPKFSYRFVFLPETIGSIAYIHKNLKNMKKNILIGYVLSCVGDNKNFSLIKSPDGNNIADQSIKSILIGKKNVKVFDYLSRGSDERQYCAPGIDLPFAGFSRTKYGEYKEYHTSEDDLNFVNKNGFNGSFKVFQNIIDVLELCLYPKSVKNCEPFMTKYNLYPTISADKRIVSDTNVSYDTKLLMDIIAYSNGKRNIFEISNILKVNLEIILFNIKILIKNKIIK